MLSSLLKVHRREVALGVLGCLILIPAVLFVALIAIAHALGPGHIEPKGWGLLVVSGGGGLALIIRALWLHRSR